MRQVTLQPRRGFAKNSASPHPHPHPHSPSRLSTPQKFTPWSLFFCFWSGRAGRPFLKHRTHSSTFGHNAAASSTPAQNYLLPPKPPLPPFLTLHMPIQSSSRSKARYSHPRQSHALAAPQAGLRSLKGKKKKKSTCIELRNCKLLFLDLLFHEVQQGMAVVESDRIQSSLLISNSLFHFRPKLIRVLSNNGLPITCVASPRTFPSEI